MASHDTELLSAAGRLLARTAGQKGKLPSARIRRSISTSYYALFHFVVEEVGLRVIGTSNDLRIRRRILARTITHKGAKVTFDKVRGANVETSVADFLRPKGHGGGQVATPIFVQTLANVFVDAQAKRHDADYDLNTPLSENDARVLRVRIRRAIARWRAASTLADRDMKAAVCTLILLKGQLRSEP